MEETRILATRYAMLPEDILLLGPTGSGKGHLARYIHDASRRPGQFLSIAGGQLSESLWESQLFGHLAGAYTDAKSRVRGAFEQAAGGTLFLDEMHHWSPSVQSGLLYPLEARRFRPLGAEREVDVTCRLVFATTQDPDDLVRKGRLPPDLRFRLPSLVLRIPGLAARREEILPLAHEFTAAILAQWQWDPARIHWSSAALRALVLHAWPGNIRELRRVIERTLAQSGPEPKSDIDAADLELPAAPGGDLAELLAPTTLRGIVMRALADANGSRQDAAALLGVHRNTISRYIARWGLPSRARSSDAPLLVHAREVQGGLRGPASA